MTTSPRSPSLRAVDHGTAHLMIYYETERLRLYRLHLQATIDRISPLAIDLAAHGEFGLDLVARRLPVPKGWPWPHDLDPLPRSVGAMWMTPGRTARVKGIAGSRAGLRLAERLRSRGVILREGGTADGEVGYIASGNELEVVARLGPCVLQASGGAGRLLLPGPLPETYLVGLRGRLIDQVVDHPVLRERGYRISSIRTDGCTSQPIVTFRTGTLPHVLPWERELQDQLERSA